MRWLPDPTGDESMCQTLGFNLDGLTTGPSAPCEENRACAPLSTAQRFAPCDGPNGEDNALRGALDFLKALPQSGNAFRAYDYNHAIASGLSNSLIELHDYSGEIDDERVVVHLYGAVGIEGYDAGTLTSAQVATLPHVWDGGQDAAWIVSEESFDLDGTYLMPRVRAEGFVRDRVLVVPQTGPQRIPLVLGGRTALTRSGTLTGLLEPPRQPGDRYRLTHVRIGLRFASREILSILGAGHNPQEDWLQLCDPSSREVYEPFVRERFCAIADLPADNGVPDAATKCGDLSSAFHATYIESRLSRKPDGGLVLGKPVTIGARGPCADDAGFEWCDDCAWDASSRCEAGSN